MLLSGELVFFQDMIFLFSFMMVLAVKLVHILSFQ